MKLDKLDKIGLLLMFAGTALSLLSVFWQPLLLPGIGLLIIGFFLWDPLGFLIP